MHQHKGKANKIKIEREIFLKKATSLKHFGIYYQLYTRVDNERNKGCKTTNK